MISSRYQFNRGEPEGSTNHKINRMHELPKADADFPLRIVLSEYDLPAAKPRDAENCEIALACKRQFDTPFVHIMRSRAYVALPASDGAPVRGKMGLWKMFRFQLTSESRNRVIEVDTEAAVAGPMMVDLVPVKESEKFGNKSSKNERFREPTGVIRKGNPGGQGGAARDVITARDALTEMGVRNYQGRSPR